MSGSGSETAVVRIEDGGRLGPVLAALSGTPADAARIRLELADFLQPEAVAAVTAWALRRRRTGAEVEIGATRRAAYFSRMHLHEILGLEPVHAAERSEEGRFLPLHLVTDGDDTVDVTNALCALVAHRIDTGPGFIPSLQWAVFEIVDNIVNHAEAAFPGVVFAQFYPKKEWLKIGICDTGRGLRASLSEGHEVPSDEAAVELACRRGVTRGAHVGQGNGLAGCREIARVNGGRFCLWSGDASLAQNVRGETRVSTTPGFPGTGVALWLKTDRPVHLADTWIEDAGWSFLDAEAVRVEERGGILVREHCLHTGGRAQARPLVRYVRSLLGAAETLVLDFEGTGFLTSSFLDELFKGLVDEAGGPSGFRSRVELRGLGEADGKRAAVVFEQRFGEGGT